MQPLSDDIFTLAKDRCKAASKAVCRAAVVGGGKNLIFSRLCGIIVPAVGIL